MFEMCRFFLSLTVLFAISTNFCSAELPQIKTLHNTKILITENNIERFDFQIFGVAVEEVEKIEIEIEHTSLAKVLNSTVSLKEQDGSENATFSVYLEGVSLGRTALKFQVITKNMTLIPLGNTLAVGVVRGDHNAMLTRIFSVSMAVMIFGNNIIMGMQLEWKVIMAVIKKPIAPSIGFVCQFGLMPLLATLYAFLLLPGEAAKQFGYFTVGCSPGGGPSNMWSLLLDGNLDLSITMTFISNVAALFMMPFWLFTLGQKFYNQASTDGEKIKIPFLDIVKSLVLLVCPIFLGILIKHFKPNIAEKSRKIVKYSTFCVAIILVPFAFYSNRFIFKLMTAKTMICGFCLPWSGFALGYVAAWICRQDFRNRKTIAIETGYQNAAIALIVMNFSLPQPDGDLATVMPFCILIFTPFPMWVALVAKFIYNKIQSRKIPPPTIEEPQTKEELLNAKELQIEDAKS